MPTVRSVAGLALLSALLPAQSLKLGEPVPALTPTKWIKGEPIGKWEPGRIYVVASWSTLCSTCAHNLDEFARLQQRYGKGGVTFVALSIGDAQNTQATVEARVAVKGQDWPFAIAFDKGAQTTTWLGSRKAGEHPAFLIDGTGKLAFLGHPTLVECAIVGLRAGKWDASRLEEWLAACVLLEKEEQDIVPATREQAQASLQKLERLLAECPGLAAVPSLKRLHCDRLFQSGRYDDACALGQALVDDCIAAKDARELNHIAWQIVDPATRVDRRDLDLALRATEKAVELSKKGNGYYLDTLACVHACRKDFAKAVELQRLAVSLQPDEDMKQRLAEWEAALQRGDKSKQPAK